MGYCPSSKNILKQLLSNAQRHERAVSQSHDLAQQRAHKAIKICWDMSLEDRNSINNQNIRAGVLDSVLCMEEHINHLAKTVLFPQSPKLIKETQQNLMDLRMSYGRLQWNIYNGHNGCYTGEHGIKCGSENHTMHLSKLSDILEMIIYDIYDQIAKYDMD